MVSNRKTLLGYEIDTLSNDGFVDMAFEKLSQNEFTQIVTINPEMIELARDNKEFSDVLKKADIVIPDGVGVQIGLRINGCKVQRVAGIEFAKNLLRKCAEKNISVALIGAKPEILEKAVKNLKSEINNLNITYARDGYFKSEEEENIAKEIANSGAKVILLALGAPKQELFAKKYEKILRNTLCVGVGGSFDVWSGVVKRAPVIFQKIGCEWFYRVLTQPSRIKRIFPTLPMFLFRVIIKRDDI